MTLGVRAAPRVGLRPPPRSAAEWSDELARPLAGAGEGVLCGVEHEYRLLRGGVQVDFRDVVHTLHLGVRGLDAGDGDAYRLPSGSAVTTDQRELEVATPPLAVAPGFTAQLAAHVEADLHALRRVLGHSARIDGYTTHLNVSIDPAHAGAAAHLYARRFAPALQLMLDDARSPGVLVRPRPGGRLELCGYHVAPWRLRATAAFAVGSALAAARAAASGDTAPLPPELDLVVEPALIRHGHYIDRRAAGVDLYAQGRRAVLRTASGAGITAQLLLREAWRAARGELLALHCDGTALRVADAVVSGALPLPGEAPPEWVPNESDGAGFDGVIDLPPSPWARIDGLRRRPGYELAPVLSTWDCAVFLLLDTRSLRRAFACVPRTCLARFLDALDGGELDALIGGYLDTAPQGRRLDRHAQTRSAGLYDELGPRAALLAAELPPASLPVTVRPHRRAATPKVIVHGTHRVCSPEQTWERIQPVLPIAGITRVAEVTRLDVIGIPVFQAIRPMSRNLSVSQGKGLTPMLARVSAVMESIELWHVEQITLPTTEASIADVAETLGYSPFSLSLATPTALSPSTRLHWLEARGAHTSRPGWVPREYIELDDTAGDRWAPPLFRVNSNGLSSGNTYDEALLHGLCEVVERDSMARFFNLPLAQRRRVDPHSIGPGDARTLLDMLDDAGARYDIVDATGPTGVATFAAIVWTDDYVLVAAGHGTHPDREVALCRAITEAVQSRATLIAGARDDIEPSLYLGGTAVEPPGITCDYADVPSVVGGDIGADVVRISRAVQALTGVEPLVVDLTREDVGVPVVRVVCPGLMMPVH